MSRQSPQTTNKANNTLASKMPNKNATATTRAESPVATEEQSLTAFFEKKKNGIAPNTNLIAPQKFNAHLNELIISKKKNNNKPPTSTNLLGFPKNKTRKNRTNKSRKNRKNRTRRS
jgi:hypothetical protein